MSHPGKTDIEAVNVTIAKLFKAISFEKGTSPSIHKIKDLFVNGGMLINFNEEHPQTFTVEAFIEHFIKLFEDKIVEGLEDREVHHKTKVYDRIAHRYSFYEARVTPAEDPFAVGVNSIQLVKESADWKISSMIWNDDIRGDGFFQRTMKCVQDNS